jgi:hypothetical protein
MIQQLPQVPLNPVLGGVRLRDVELFNYPSCTVVQTPSKEVCDFYVILQILMLLRDRFFPDLFI